MPRGNPASRAELAVAAGRLSRIPVGLKLPRPQAPRPVVFIVPRPSGRQAERWGFSRVSSRPAPQRGEQRTAKQNSLETPGPLCTCTTFRHAVQSRDHNISMKEACWHGKGPRCPQRGLLLEARPRASSRQGYPGLSMTGPRGTSGQGQGQWAGWYFDRRRAR